MIRRPNFEIPEEGVTKSLQTLAAHHDTWKARAEKAEAALAEAYERAAQVAETCQPSGPIHFVGIASPDVLWTPAAQCKEIAAAIRSLARRGKEGK